MSTGIAIAHGHHHVSAEPHRWRATAALAGGLVGLAVTAPIAGSYINKRGLGPSEVAGLVAVVGCIALISAGVRSLLKGGRTRRKFLAIPIALIVAQFFPRRPGQMDPRAVEFFTRFLQEELSWEEFS